MDSPTDLLVFSLIFIEFHGHGCNSDEASSLSAGTLELSMRLLRMQFKTL